MLSCKVLRKKAEFKALIFNALVKILIENTDYYGFKLDRVVNFDYKRLINRNDNHYQ